MRQFGLTYDDAIAIQSSLFEGLRAQNRLYQSFSHDLSSMEKRIAKEEMRRSMKKIAYLNSFTKAKSKPELRDIGKLVVE
ncbi:hypothetical protein HUB98_26365 [Paenibacillus barcinonensis]|uniref:Uncharacterized protein n=1 Tax=Paenibacillus barcinonensis TaxID=198119 RepID=A0A2V4W269_PAEBA|nr:hypothetical protein [Paenibacillus barcinonensis]PYE52513.1 hypothetical protein DFQ00_101451 [Paenibacillus barcinonensis]QKS59328.1 hypothetical protein HUB98_26075 [Paenibacillus barcinonensis]QKS59382.1 hypothetical protein HUB98_26365 [Paenibacillus barcinonensis]